MEVSKPVAIGILVVALIALAAALWFSFGSGGNQGGVPESAYPKSEGGQGVEAVGAEPLYTGSGPASTLPLEGQASSGGGR
ncbi:MAG: hypothetical protein N2554_03600 [Fimbriimonadales bacterium]|nr:hypothetical protein [Fimbriimonadales bacterium]